jgi:hypothetical protein
MYLGLLVGICFAVLFVRAATYEHMSPVLWGASSFALSLAVGGLGGGLVAVIGAQVGLLILMWWYNAFRKQGR